MSLVSNGKLQTETDQAKDKRATLDDRGFPVVERPAHKTDSDDEQQEARRMRRDG